MAVRPKRQATLTLKIVWILGLARIFKKSVEFVSKATRMRMILRASSKKVTVLETSGSSMLVWSRQA